MAPALPLACAPPTQCSVSWPHKDLHRRDRCYRPRAYPPPSTAFRGPIRSSTDGPSATARMRPPHPAFASP
eukprot:3735643-Pyramimonas_sp.AAC.1